MNKASQKTTVWQIVPHTYVCTYVYLDNRYDVDVITVIENTNNDILKCHITN